MTTSDSSSSPTKRYVVFFSLYVGYVGYYLAKKNYGFWMPLVAKRLQMSRGEVAVVQTSLETSMGLFKLVAGPLVDMSQPHVIFCLGLALSSLCNFLLLSSTSLSVMSLVWGLNGLAQSVGWPAMTKIFMKHFKSPKERGKWYGLLSTSQNAGSALSPLILVPAIAYLGEYSTMWLPAGICLVLALFAFHTLDSAEVDDVGEKKLSKKDRRPTVTAPSSSPSDGDKDFRAIVQKEVFLNWKLWVLGLSYLFVTLLRCILSDWAPSFLFENKALSLSEASTCLFALEMGGFVGSLAAGWITDNLYGGRRAPIIVSFSFIAAPLSLAITQLDGLPLLSLCYFCLGFLSFPPHMLAGLFARELADPRVSETGGGLVKFLGQLGGAAAGAPFGFFIEANGWALLPLFSCLCSLLAALAALPLFFFGETVGKKTQKMPEKMK